MASSSYLFSGMQTQGASPYIRSFFGNQQLKPFTTSIKLYSTLMSAPPVFDSFLWPCFTEISHGQTFENPREFSYSLPQFSFSNLGKFRGLLSSILKPSRCPRSQKFSKFENENKHFRGLRSCFPPQSQRVVCIGIPRMYLFLVSPITLQNFTAVFMSLFSHWDVT